MGFNKSVYRAPLPSAIRVSLFTVGLLSIVASASGQLNYSSASQSIQLQIGVSYPEGFIPYYTDEPQSSLISNFNGNVSKSYNGNNDGGTDLFNEDGNVQDSYNGTGSGNLSTSLSSASFSATSSAAISATSNSVGTPFYSGTVKLNSTFEDTFTVANSGTYTFSANEMTSANSGNGSVLYYYLLLDETTSTTVAGNALFFNNVGNNLSTSTDVQLNSSDTYEALYQLDVNCSELFSAPPGSSAYSANASLSVQAAPEPIPTLFVLGSIGYFLMRKRP